MVETKIVSEVKSWILKNKLEFVILMFILLAGAFLRLYKIGGYMTFLGDEGRDALIVRRLLVNFDPILIGPGTSIGNMYIGPLYYYLIAPALLLANFSPVGPSILVALFGVATVFLVWFITKQFFSKFGAVVASGLYAIAPTVVIYSKSSWNPNVMPFFSLLSIYSIWRVWEKKDYKWLAVLGISFAFVLQSHWLGLLLLPVLGLYWLLTKKDKGFWKYSFWGGGLFLFLMSPLVIFDFRHGWMNFNAIKVFFTERETTVAIKPWKAIDDLWPLWTQISTRLLGGRIEIVGLIIAVFLGVGILWLFYNRSNYRKQLVFLLIWLVVGMVGLGLYKHHIYDHYFGFIFPAVFILLGAVFGEVYQYKNDLIRSGLMFGFIGLFLINLENAPIVNPPNRQLERTAEMARFVVKLSEGEKFNFGIIAEQNYEDAYQYFLEKWDTNMVEIDPSSTNDTIAKYLLVVCEKEKEKCDPTHSPKAEIANFGWSEILEEHDIWGTTIYKLGHVQQ